MATCSCEVWDVQFLEGRADIHDSQLTWTCAYTWRQQPLQVRISLIRKMINLEQNHHSAYGATWSIRIDGAVLVPALIWDLYQNVTNMNKPEHESNSGYITRGKSEAHPFIALITCLSNFRLRYHSIHAHDERVARLEIRICVRDNNE